ncbi:hypothetical protein ACTJKN_22515 [Pedobacter sp. 22163]|uniref:hypothetical protein n=1 Tax=Pedobacter sp. 22163 TaxID=3453883 RepID=UPI003F82877F
MKLQLGKFLYRLYFQPTLKYRYNITHFGFRGWFKMHQGEKAMKKAALKLRNQLQKPLYQNIELNFLTGKNYWHQTIFCIESFIKSYGNNIAVKIYSDGSINKEITTIFKKYCNEIIIVKDEEIKEKLNEVLPVSMFPTLNYLRNWHPFFRRLIDIHAESSWKIHLDSDMLFLKLPTEIFEAYTNKSAIYMFEQLNSSYFVDDSKIIKDKFGIDLVEKVNGGVVAYNGSLVDYVDLEKVAKTLMINYSKASPAEIEQTLMSYLLYKQNAFGLNKHEYKIYYESEHIDLKDNTLRHYIYKAKYAYLTAEWKKLVH